MVVQPLPKKMRVAPQQQEMTSDDASLINALQATHSNPDVFKAFTSIKQTRAAGEGMMSGLLQKTSDPDAAFDRAISAVLSAVGMKQVGFLFIHVTDAWRLQRATHTCVRSPSAPGGTADAGHRAHCRH